MSNKLLVLFHRSVQGMHILCSPTCPWPLNWKVEVAWDEAAWRCYLGWLPWKLLISAGNGQKFPATKVRIYTLKTWFSCGSNSFCFCCSLVGQWSRHVWWHIHAAGVHALQLYMWSWVSVPAWFLSPFFSSSSSNIT